MSDIDRTKRTDMSSDLGKLRCVRSGKHVTRIPNDISKQVKIIIGSDKKSIMILVVVRE